VVTITEMIWEREVDELQAPFKSEVETLKARICEMEALIMVLKPQPMSDDMAARVTTQSSYQAEQEAFVRAAIDSIPLRQWCVDQAVKVCGTEGVVWHCEPPMPTSAVVPIAEGIFRFITGGDKL